MTLDRAFAGFFFAVCAAVLVIAAVGFARRSPRFPRDVAMRSLSGFGLACALLASGAFLEGLGALHGPVLQVAGSVLLLVGMAARFVGAGAAHPTVPRRPAPYPRSRDGSWWFQKR